MSPTEQLAARIKAACDSTPPKTKARNKALSEVRWVMKVANSSVDVYCCLKNGRCDLTADINEASVFDGRDNEEMKLRFWSASVGEPLELVLL
jgi:hypothetical protein